MTIRPTDILVGSEKISFSNQGGLASNVILSVAKNLSLLNIRPFALLRETLYSRLLPSIKEGIGRIPIVEIMTFSPTIRKLIMDEEDQKLPDAIRMSGKEGMQDFNGSLVEMINKKLITKKTALTYSPNPEQLKMNLQGIFLSDDRKILG